MSTLLKKIVLSLSLAFVAFLPFASFVSPISNAQDLWYDNDFPSWYGMVYDDDNPSELFGERYTAAQVEWVYYGTISFFLNHFGDRQLNKCVFVGDESSCVSAGAEFLCDTALKLFPGSDIICEFASDAVDEVINEVPTQSTIASSVATPKPQISNENRNSAITSVSNITNSPLALSISRPLSSTEYFYDIGTRLHIIPEAQAQGFGFNQLNPVLEIWRTVRNLTYTLIIFVVIIMAFMIMFRVKLSPQVVISVQSALPKVIITLLLITFSYPIAGLMIDLMYVTIGLLASMLTTGGTNAISDWPWTKMFGALTNDRSIFSIMSYYIATFSVASILAIGQSGFLGASTAIGTSLATFGMLPIVIFIIVSIVLFIALIRIMWLMLKTYVMVIMLVMFGPIQILFGAFGGGGFGKWIKDLATHLAVYPAVGFMFILSFIFLAGALPASLNALTQQFMPYNIKNLFGSEQAWDPPLTMGSGNNELLWLGASFVIILMIPRVGDAIKGFMSGRPYPLGTAIGESLAPTTSRVQGGANQGWAATKAGVGTRMLESNPSGIRGIVGGALGGKVPRPL